MERYVALQQGFKEHCERVLSSDISKWSDYKQFYADMSSLYSAKIDKEKLANESRRSRIRELQSKLKGELLENKQFKSASSVNLRTEACSRLVKPSDSTKRMKTDTSLPSLNMEHSQKRLNTSIGDSTNRSTKRSYMDPIGYRKVKEQSLLPTLLRWLDELKR